jgi:hypothetical protein
VVKSRERFISWQEEAEKAFQPIFWGTNMNFSYK